MVRPTNDMFGRLTVCLLIACLCCCTISMHGQETGYRRVHDPAIIKCGQSYYVFSTGPGLPVRRSSDLLTWNSVAPVFTQLPAWAKEAVPGANWIWAPDISHWGGKYHLYYSISTFGSNRSCIGLATNDTLDPQSPQYKWMDQGKIVESTPGKDNWNAIDPNLVLDEQGEPWLAFGSFWSGIKLRRLDPATGKLSARDDTLYSLARRPSPGAVEAPFIIRKNGFYYLFVSFDLCCKGVNSTYKIMVGRARAVQGPYADRDGKPMMEGGATLILESKGRVRGPGHNAILLEEKGDYLVHHYYDADENGRAKLQVRPLTWDAAGWPAAGEPLGK